MSYHKNKNIKKGTIGEFSKIEEEFEELKDAVDQDDKILILCEMADLLGAVELYLKENYYKGITLESCIEFSRKTQNAFKDGTRKNSDEYVNKKSWTEEDIRPMCMHESWDEIVHNESKSELTDVWSDPYIFDKEPSIQEKMMRAYVKESTREDDMRVIACIDEELHKLNKEISEKIDGWHDTSQDKSFNQLLQFIKHEDKVRMKTELEEMLEQDKNFDDEIEDFVYTQSDEV